MMNVNHHDHEAGHDHMHSSYDVAVSASVSASIASTPPNLFNIINAQFRHLMTLRIYRIFTRNTSLSTDTFTSAKIFDTAKKIEMALMKDAKSEAEYSDLQTLESRVSVIVGRLTSYQERVYRGTSIPNICGHKRSRPEHEHEHEHGVPHVFGRNQSNTTSPSTTSSCELNFMPTTFRNPIHFSGIQSQPPLNNSMGMSRGWSISNVESCGPSNPYGVTTSSSGSRRFAEGINPFKLIHPIPIPIPRFNMPNPQPLQQTPSLQRQLVPYGNFQSASNFNPIIVSRASDGFNPYHLQIQSRYQHESQVNTNHPLIPLSHPLQNHHTVTTWPLRDVTTNLSIPTPSTSILSQKKSSLHNSNPLSQETNEVIMEHASVNLIPQTPLLHDCLSTRTPLSHQTVSPTITLEEQYLTDANTTTSKEVVSADSDPHFRNQVRWLLLLIHARYCVAPENACASKYCFDAKEILKHTYSCKVPFCGYRYCSQTQKLLRHFQHCMDQSCPVCVPVNSYIKKEKEKESRQPSKRAYPEVLDHVDKHPSDKRLKLEQTSFHKLSKRAYNEEDVEVPSVNAELQPSLKRLRLQQPLLQDNASESEEVLSITKSHSSMDRLEKDGVEFMHVEREAYDASKNPITKDPEKNVGSDIRNDGGSDESVDQSISETSVAKEEIVKQCMEAVVDDSKNVISSLIQSFNPEQVKEHITSLHQWVGQSKSKTEKNKAEGQLESKNGCQLCDADDTLAFEPLPIYCSSCGARIKRNANHYKHSPHHLLCSHCFNENRDELVVVVDGTSIPRSSFIKKKNEEELEEPWVQCDKCEKWQHQICGLFNEKRNNSEAEYTCPYCYIKELEKGDRAELPLNAIPGSQALPVTDCSRHIEQRLLEKLDKERHERAKHEGKTYDQVPGAESLSIRVVSSIDKVLPVKERFFELFREENYPSEFPYKSKTILMFQKIEGVEVCLYAMFVQEYGTKSGAPNQRRTNISYLDSVKYFTPQVQTVSGESLRTFVYQQILVGYLDFCKRRGFTSCYIWSCPPIKGEDYILYCHPKIQKIPKLEKLREWYLAMLKKALDEKVVVEITNVYDHFFVQSGESKAKVTTTRLPYFDGDYWPAYAEELIQDMEKTKKNQRGKVDDSNLSSKDMLLMEQLGKKIRPLKEDFIMIHLQHCCKHCSNFILSETMWVCKDCKGFYLCHKCFQIEKKRDNKEKHPLNKKKKHQLYPVAISDVPTEIEDKDDNIESDFCENREAFLKLCQRNNFQFDTLRRAKHSSMMILYHLHNPDAPSLPTTCNTCGHKLEKAQSWHCEICPNYDLCNVCYLKGNNHLHNLIARPSLDQNSQTNQHSENQLQKLRELLLHMVVCRSSNCPYESCHTIKKLCRHCTTCTTGFSGGCNPCKKFWGLLKFHARYCRDLKCGVIRCRNLKTKHQEMLERQSRGDDAKKQRDAEATQSVHM